MSYPRNAAAPPTVTLGAILQISDGAVQTTGASVRVKTGTGAWGAGSGTLACDTTSGVWTYLPTQAETDDTHFSVAAYKTGCVPVGVTVITSASATAGYAGIDWSKVANPTTTLGLSGTTVKAVTDAPADSSGITTLLTRIVGTLASGTHTPQTGDAYAIVAHATYGLAALKTLIDAIKAKTDNLPVDPADASDISSAFATVNSTLATIAAYIDTEVAAIKAKTDNLPATPASTGDIPSAAANAAAVLAALDTAGDLDAQLDAILAAASATSGSGAYTRTIIINDGTTALQGAKVRLTQGAESYVGTTNASGQVVFAVDAATWSVAITKANYSFTPTTLVVSGSGSTTYSMTASGPTPSADPDKTTVRITCYSADTEPEASATVQLRQTTIPASDTGNAFDGDWTTYTADANGIVDVTLWSGAEYALRRGAAGPMTKFTPTGASYAVSSVVGKSA